MNTLIQLESSMRKEFDIYFIKQLKTYFNSAIKKAYTEGYVNGIEEVKNKIKGTKI